MLSSNDFLPQVEAKKEIVARPDNMMKWLQVWSVSRILFLEGAVHMPSRHIYYVFYQENPKILKQTFLTGTFKNKIFQNYENKNNLIGG